MLNTNTKGQEKFHGLAPLYYHGAHVALLVYDITDANSFGTFFTSGFISSIIFFCQSAKAKYWVAQLQEHANQDIVIALIGAYLFLFGFGLVSSSLIHPSGRDTQAIKWTWRNHEKCQPRMQRTTPPTTILFFSKHLRNWGKMCLSYSWLQVKTILHSKTEKYAQEMNFPFVNKNLDFLSPE